MHFIEAIPQLYKLLDENISRYDWAKAYNVCVSDTDGEHVHFKITSNEGQSSSILDFGTHLQEHPNVKVIRTIDCVTTRLDTLFKDGLPDVDFLNMDLQGAELMALRGMGELLKQFNYVYIEVNERELYKGCPLLPELDEYLYRYGFTRVELSMTNFGWGDAFYVKQ